MVKWTQRVFQYNKIKISLVKGLKVVANCCLNWISVLDDLCYCVEYSNVENQVEIFSFIIKSDAQMQMIEYGFKHRYMTITIVKLEFSFILLEFNIYLRISS